MNLLDSSQRDALVLHSQHGCAAPIRHFYCSSVPQAVTIVTAGDDRDSDIDSASQSFKLAFNYNSGFKLNFRRVEVEVCTTIIILVLPVLPQPE